MWIPALALSCLPWIGRASLPDQDVEVLAWLQKQAIQLDASSNADLERFVQALGPVRVLGLGEATHGQRECFAFKRRLTMHLIAEHGFRVVAYEASATGARVVNAYVCGESEDLDEALRGFGMLIWMVEENRSLLQDLRTWNQSAGAEDRVEFIGIDVQNAGAAARRLGDLLEDALPELAAEARDLGPALVAARDAAYGGDASAVEGVQARLAAFSTKLFNRSGDLAMRTSRAHAKETMGVARELVRFPGVPANGSMRDRGMALSMLDALATREPGTKAVLWAHNGHITKGPLRYMGGGENFGVGGYLRASIGDDYYALGVDFGSGGFQALDRDEEGKWWFRRYKHKRAVTGSLADSLLTAGLHDALIDLRGAPAEGPVRAWLEAPHGVRSWGGYRVPEDPDGATSDASSLPKSVLAEDYDGLLFLKQTTSAEPVDADLIWK